MSRLVLAFRLALLVGAGATIWAQTQPPQNKTLYVVTHIDVYPNFAADTAALLKQFSSDSMKDAGAVRFEVLRDVERVNHFTVVEVWKSRAAYEERTSLLLTPSHFATSFSPGWAVLSTRG